MYPLLLLINGFFALANMNDNICYFLASTNIASFEVYSKWECDNFVPVNGGPCNQTAGQWEGVICLGLHLNIVSQIYLLEEGVIGTIPSELSLITSLIAITLPHNSLFGSIPSELCNLLSLSDLDLSYNSFSNSLPTCIGNFKELYALQLSNNKFTGAIPTGIGDMSSLSALVLQNNKFRSTIPNEITKLFQLYDVVIPNNELTGMYFF